MMWCLHNFDKDKRSKTSQLKFYLKIWQVKNSLGIKFEEIRLIFDKLKVDGMFDEIHVTPLLCTTTCGKKGDVKKTLDHFRSIVGFKELKACVQL